MTADPAYPLLESIDSPEALRTLPRSRLPELARELRAFLIETVSSTGGHLASNLGVVELTIALHYIYDTPEDRLVWDVGHQSYPHKILTGRRREMTRLRQRGGISGFTKISESPYDTFGAGHSSTSISAALGMAVAARARGESRRVVAIIGDGAIGAGMAFEALNHASDVDADLLVVLNDNEMSISPNVGGLSNHLARLLSGRLYSTVREGSKSVLNHMPSSLRELARRAEEHMKGMVIPGTLFEELGFNYIGPVDGHDLDTLVTTLGNMRSLRGPQLLHIVTRKGKGFEPAEANPCAFHGVSRFDPVTGAPTRPVAATPTPPPTWTSVFGQWVCRAAEREPLLMAITPAMCEGSGLTEFRFRFASRFFDVGIAEQHAVTFAAGLAREKMKPVVAIYSTFLQRAYDQLIHDVALQNLPVLFAIDRAGIVGPDGPTHAGSFDLSYLRCVPNLTIMAPADEAEMVRMLETGLQCDGPAAVRYPRGAATGCTVPQTVEPLELGRGRVVREGREVALLSFGTLLPAALEAAEALDATVADMRFVKPLDEALILDLARSHRRLVTIEENVVAGGAGEGVAEVLQAHRLTVPVIHLGLPDRFVEQGSREELLALYGLDAASIRAAASGDDCNTPPGTVISY